MRVFVYEAITAGAGWAQGADSAPGNALVSEGLAMLRAVTEDFAAMEGVEVWGLRDRRYADFELRRREVVIPSAAEERGEFQRLANVCDWALIIAPELDGMLEERVAWVMETNARLLSPSGDFLKIASSKTKTAERLSERGIPVPAHVGVPPLGGIGRPPEGGTPTFPLVLKRDDGAGSVRMRLIHNREELEALGYRSPSSANSAPLRDAHLQYEGITQRRRERGENAEEYRLERFCPGLAASVAILCGPGEDVPLQPCEQILNPATFEYLGGRMPLPPHLENRAKSLALAAIAAMPPTTGYVGVDLVLGEQAKGSEDVVIEINPRLTTSYVGLRQACRQNLAQAMLDMARGRPVDLSFRDERVEFRVDGSRS
ncbi:MAG: ATP-grasp domain-containing protein [Pirellulaceae bacterium]